GELGVPLVTWNPGEIVGAHDPGTVRVRIHAVTDAVEFVFAGDPVVEEAVEVAVPSPGDETAHPLPERRVGEGGQPLGGAEGEAEDPDPIFEGQALGEEGVDRAGYA